MGIYTGSAASNCYPLVLCAWMPLWRFVGQMYSSQTMEVREGKFRCASRYIYIYMSIIERYYIYIYYIGSACIVIYIYLAGPPARRPMMKLLVSAAAGRQPLK